MKGKKDASALLTARQERFIVALLVSPTLAEAAHSAGISEVTAWRWLKDPAFQLAYRAVKRQCMDQAIAQAYEATNEAISTLRSVMKDPKVSASARVSAAKAVWEIAHRSSELEDMEARIVALEANQP